MTTVKDAIKHLQTYKLSDVIALIIWQADDVIERAKERGIKITKKQAEEIIEEIDGNHDATMGVTWDTIDEATDIYLDEMKEEKKSEKVDFT